MAEPKDDTSVDKHERPKAHFHYLRNKFLALVGIQFLKTMPGSFESSVVTFPTKNISGEKYLGRLSDPRVQKCRSRHCRHRGTEKHFIFLI